MQKQLLDHPRNTLGEGPLWHPTQQRFYWVDIPEKRVYCQSNEVKFWQFEQKPGALAWIDDRHLLIAMESGLYQFDSLSDDTHISLVVAFDHDTELFRSNDGRADPWGGFWISTLRLDESPGLAKIFRYYQGQLSCVVDNLTIPNGICFSKQQNCAFFADSPSGKIYRVALDPNTGALSGEPQLFIDRSADQRIPDGAIIDAQQQLWTTHWGSNEIVCYSKEGELLNTIPTQAKQPTCPAFGGDKLQDLYITSASIGIDTELTKADGQVLVLSNCVQGIAEPAVIIS